jgi:hypothetical protein
VFAAHPYSSLLVVDWIGLISVPLSFPVVFVDEMVGYALISHRVVEMSNADIGSA